MALLNKLPGFERAPAGLEWKVLRRLPAIAVAGTALPFLAALAVAWFIGGDPAADKLAMSLHIALASALVLHWTAVFTVALACVIV